MSKLKYFLKKGKSGDKIEISRSQAKEAFEDLDQSELFEFKELENEVDDMGETAYMSELSKSTSQIHYLFVSSK
jgi:hypothetical protein